MQTNDFELTVPDLYIETRQRDDNDDDDDDDSIDDDAIDDDDNDNDDVEIQQNDTNVPEGTLVHSTAPVLTVNSSTKERMLQHKSNVSNVSQSTGGDGVITKIWRMVKALLKAVKNFWFKITGGQEKRNW